MSNSTTLKVDGNNRRLIFPNRCPLCHNIVTITSHISFSNHKPKYLEVIYVCPNNDCQQYFIGYYSEIGQNDLRFDYFLPTNVNMESFTNEICELSPDFIDIYKEAEEAKQKNLLQIAGPGFRKAFEFLIKDYAISKSDKDKDKIKIAFSGEVVNKYIEDSRIQRVAKRALWLGNDETHYLRKWEQHDLNDLNILIRLTVRWIEIEQLSNKYEEAMPDK